MNDSPLSPARITPLDGIRGLAILLVLSDHLWILPLDMTDGLNRLWTSGYLGVDLFFVLSGFLITRGLRHTRDAPGYFRNFYIKRIARILPLYWTVMIMVALFVWFIEPRSAPRDGYDSLLWPFTLTINWAIAFKQDWLFHSHYVVLDHFWALAVEWQLYLLWPFLIHLARGRWLLVALVALIGIAFGTRVGIAQAWGHWSHGAYLLTPCRMDQFAIGALLALLWQKEQWLQRVDRVAPWLLGCLGIWVMHLTAVGGPHWKRLVIGLFFALLMHCAMRYPVVQRLFSTRLLQHLGKHSYAIYIFHHLFYPSAQRFVWRGLLGGLPDSLQQTLYVVIVLSIAYLLARLSWVLIERPAMRKGHAFLTRHRNE